MKRRAFLSKPFSQSPVENFFAFLEEESNAPRTDAGSPNSGPRRTLAGLEPYVPTPQQPWDFVRASHLLRRTIFLPTYDQVQFALTKTPGEVIDLLLQDQPLPASPGGWVDELLIKPTTTEEKNQYESQNLSRMESLRAWWCSLMKNDSLSLVEKMTFFWHGHITSEGKEVLIPQLIYHQNQMLRSFALGNFKEMMKRVNSDAAMLRYLGGDINVKGKPNENYGRELMELYTIGLDNYTEQDIKENARVLTGWRVNEFQSLESYFDPNLHDSGNKTVMGRTILGRSTYSGGKEESDDLINIIFDRQEVATFICRKLYRTFVYDNPARVDETIVTEMANVFRQNNYELKPALGALLKSKHFFDDVNIGAMIKSPANFDIGLYRQLELSASGGAISTEMKSMEQTVIDPPNVKGWEGYRTWISTTTYPFRKTFAERAVTSKRNEIQQWVKKFASYTDVNIFLETVLALFLPKPISTTRRKIFLDTLLNGAYATDWNIDDARFQQTTINLLTLIVNAPDYQLH